MTKFGLPSSISPVLLGFLAMLSFISPMFMSSTSRSPWCWACGHWQGLIAFGIRSSSSSSSSSENVVALSLSTSRLVNPDSSELNWKLPRRRIPTRRLKYYSMLTDVTVNCCPTSQARHFDAHLSRYSNAAQSADKFSGAGRESHGKLKFESVV